jgi:IclR family pca regulon transcriptional regulator
MIETGDQDPKSIIRSLAKGLQVLQVFTAEEPELVLAEVARRAGLDNGTTYRILNTLVLIGFLEKVPGTRRFRLTLKCLDLGFSAISRMDLRAVARPVLRGLVGAMVDAASVSILDGADIVYIERIESGLARPAVDVRIGTRTGALHSAIGHVILAFLAASDQARILAQGDAAVAAVTRSGLDRIRADGFAVSDREDVPGLRVLAAPIFDTDNAPIAALSIHSIASRMPLRQFAELTARPTIEAARHVSRALQAAGSSKAGGLSS